MPLLEDQKTIVTKIINVTESDGFNGRQAILLDIFTNPDKVELMFINDHKIYVIIQDKKLYLGDIRDQYKSYITDNSFIRKWKITGGYKLPNCKQSAYFGVNIEIKI